MKIKHFGYKLKLPLEVIVTGNKIKISYNKLDLEKMKKQLDLALESETEESLKEWLNQKRKL